MNEIDKSKVWGTNCFTEFLENIKKKIPVNELMKKSIDKILLNLFDEFI